MKTADEIIEEIFLNGHFDIGKPSKEQIKQAMIEFAENHVTQALINCCEKATVDRHSILVSYLLENIK